VVEEEEVLLVVLAVVALLLVVLLLAAVGEVRVGNPLAVPGRLPLPLPLYIGNLDGDCVRAPYPLDLTSFNCFGFRPEPPNDNLSLSPDELNCPYPLLPPTIGLPRRDVGNLDGCPCPPDGVVAVAVVVVEEEVAVVEEEAVVVGFLTFNAPRRAFRSASRFSFFSIASCSALSLASSPLRSRLSAASLNLRSISARFLALADSVAARSLSDCTLPLLLRRRLESTLAAGVDFVVDAVDVSPPAFDNTAPATAANTSAAFPPWPPPSALPADPGDLLFFCGMKDTPPPLNMSVLFSRRFDSDVAFAAACHLFGGVLTVELACWSSCSTLASLDRSDGDRSDVAFAAACHLFGARAVFGGDSIVAPVREQMSTRSTLPPLDGDEGADPSPSASPEFPGFAAVSRADRNASSSRLISAFCCCWCCSFAASASPAFFFMIIAFRASSRSTSKRSVAMPDAHDSISCVASFCWSPESLLRDPDFPLGESFGAPFVLTGIFLPSERSTALNKNSATSICPPSCAKSSGVFPFLSFGESFARFATRTAATVR